MTIFIEKIPARNKAVALCTLHLIILFLFLVTQKVLRTLQNEERQEGMFELVDIPKYDIITLLNRKVGESRKYHFLFL